MRTAIWLVNAHVSGPNSADVVPSDPTALWHIHTYSAFQQILHAQAFFFQAWISMCHWTLLNASISIVTWILLRISAGIALSCTPTQVSSNPTAAECLGRLGPRNAGWQIIKPTWDIAHNPLQHQPGNWKNEIKWSSQKDPKGKLCLSHSVILVARRCSVLGFCFATERLKPLVTLFELWNLTILTDAFHIGPMVH